MLIRNLLQYSVSCCLLTEVSVPPLSAWHQYCEIVLPLMENLQFIFARLKTHKLLAGIVECMMSWRLREGMDPRDGLFCQFRKLTESFKNRQYVAYMLAIILILSL